MSALGGDGGDGRGDAGGIGDGRGDGDGIGDVSGDGGGIGGGGDNDGIGDGRDDGGGIIAEATVKIIMIIRNCRAHVHQKLDVLNLFSSTCISSDLPFRGEGQSRHPHHPKPEARRWSCRLPLTFLPHPHLGGSPALLNFQALLSALCHDRWPLSTGGTVPIITVHLDHCQAAALSYSHCLQPTLYNSAISQMPAGTCHLLFLLTKILQWTL